MIHYDVWFSFNNTVADEDAEISKFRNFLGDLKSRGLTRDHTLRHPFRG